MLPRFALLTVVLLYLVVLAGSIVRATGSGMGCPDWPKCYGQLIPPTRVEDIDFSTLDITKFREVWKGKGGNPVEVSEESLRRDFDAGATWTEFINRVIGALSGLSALLALICALAGYPRRWPLLAALVLQFILFGLAAWPGKVVVDHNLLPWKITMHMVVAVALVTTALVVLHLAKPGAAIPVKSSLRWQLGLALVLTLAQIVVGTQVRETVDHLDPGTCCDGRLEQHLGLPLVWHRVGAIAVLSLVAISFFRLKFSPSSASAAPWLSVLPGLVVAVEYAAGVILIRAELPRALQPVHLVLAVLLHGMLIALLLRSRLHRESDAVKLSSAT